MRRHVRKLLPVSIGLGWYKHRIAGGHRAQHGDQMFIVVFQSFMFCSNFRGQSYCVVCNRKRVCARRHLPAAAARTHGAPVPVRGDGNVHRRWEQDAAHQHHQLVDQWGRCVSGRLKPVARLRLSVTMVREREVPRKVWNNVVFVSETFR